MVCLLCLLRAICSFKQSYRNKGHISALNMIQNPLLILKGQGAVLSSQLMWELLPLALHTDVPRELLHPSVQRLEGGCGVSSRRRLLHTALGGHPCPQDTLGPTLSFHLFITCYTGSLSFLLGEGIHGGGDLPRVTAGRVLTEIYLSHLSFPGEGAPPCRLWSQPPTAAPTALFTGAAHGVTLPSGRSL